MMSNLEKLKEGYLLLEPCLISSARKLFEELFTALEEERAVKNEYRKLLEKELHTSFCLDSDPEQ